MKVYRVQDLAMSGRKITIDGIEVVFEGFYATVPESIVYYFNRMDEYQVFQPTEVKSQGDLLADTLGYVPAPKENPLTGEHLEEQKAKQETTVSPNLAEVTKEEPKKIEVKPRDDAPKVEAITVPVSSTIKPRTAQN